MHLCDLTFWQLAGWLLGFYALALLLKLAIWALLSLCGVRVDRFTF
jgi:hypothetical protein